MVKELLTFCWTRKHITVFTTYHHRSLSPARLIQSALLNSVALISVQIPSHACLYLPSGIFLSGLRIQILYTIFFSSMRAKCLSHLMLLDCIIITISDDHYKLWSSLLCIFLQSPVTLSLSGPNIVLCTLFSNTLNHNSINIYYFEALFIQ